MKNDGFISLSGIIIIIIFSIILFNSLSLLPKKYLILQNNFKKQSIQDLSLDIFELIELNKGDEYEKLRNEIVKKVINNNYGRNKLSLEEIYKNWIKNSPIEKITLNQKDSTEIDIEVVGSKDNIEIKNLGKYSYVNSYFLEENFLEEDYDLIKKGIDLDPYKYINDDFYSNENLSKKSLNLEKYNNVNKVIDFEDIEEFTNKPVYIILKEPNASLSVGRPSVEERTINLEGIMFVNGNLIVHNKFDFKGILIVTGDIIVKRNGSLKVDGFLNKETSSNPNKYYYNYNFGKIKKYGIYIPGFIRFKILNVKRT